MRHAIFLLMSWAVLVAAPVFSDTSSVNLTMTPESMTLCSGEAGKLLVTLRNNSTTDIHNTCLSFFSNGPVEATFSTLPASATGNIASESCKGIMIPKLPKGGAWSTMTNVKMTGLSQSGAALNFQALYPLVESLGEGSATELGAVAISNPPMPNADALKLETTVAFTSLHECESGNVLLKITNNTNEAMTIHTPVLGNLPFARVTEAKDTDTANETPDKCSDTPKDSDTANKTVAFTGKASYGSSLSIPPQSTLAFVYTIKANPSITPGKYAGLIDVDATTKCGVQLHQVASYEATLGVFGQSEVLTAIGVPSLLLLPGFLVLTLCMLIWRRKSAHISFLKKDDTDEFVVKASEPEFWVVAITISLIIFAYARNFAGFGYLKPYNLTDIAMLWFKSLLGGLVLYVILFYVDRLLSWIEEKKAADIQKQVDERRLKERDDVLSALKKMLHRKFDISQRKPVTSTDPANAFNGFELWTENQGNTYWVIPPIVCEKHDNAPDTWDPFKNQNDTAALFESLNEAKNKRWADVRWGAQADFKGPMELQRSAIKEATVEFDFVSNE